MTATFSAFVNHRLVAFGPPAETFTPETLHATFGGELLILQSGDHRHVHAGGHHGIGLGALMGWLTDPLGYNFALRALAEVVVMGVSCGAIGAYVIVRRLAFIGDAISHAVFPGIVIAYLLGASIVLGRIGGGCADCAWRSGGSRAAGGSARTPSIGIFFAAAFALGVVLISTQQTYQGDLTGFLIGNLQARLGRRHASSAE